MSKILIIDDERDFLELIKEWLVENGYEVRIATDYDTGIQTAIMLKPDVIICDLLLPGKNGHEVIKKIRSIDKNVLIIVVSIIQEFQSIERAYECGADFYMSKPPHLRTLNKCIKLLSRRTHVSRAESFE